MYFSCIGLANQSKRIRKRQNLFPLTSQHDLIDPWIINQGSQRVLSVNLFWDQHSKQNYVRHLGSSFD